MKKNYFIKIEEESKSTKIQDLKISGVFSVPNNELSIGTQNAEILKHIIIVVTRSENYQSFTPFLDVIVFKDDVKTQSDLVSGKFKVKLRDHIKFDGSGEFYIICSLGACTSNILKIVL